MMNATASDKSEYLLLFRGSDWYRRLSPEEIQHTMGQWTEWFDRLVETGKCKGGHPLAEEGRIVSGKGRTVTDGPFVESKEAVGGYFFLQVEDLDEALAIAKECPALVYGLTVEVRPVLPNCPAVHMAQNAGASMLVGARA